MQIDGDDGDYAPPGAPSVEQPLITRSSPAAAPSASSSTSSARGHAREGPHAELLEQLGALKAKVTKPEYDFKKMRVTVRGLLLQGTYVTSYPVISAWQAELAHQGEAPRRRRRRYFQNQNSSKANDTNQDNV